MTHGKGAFIKYHSPVFLPIHGSGIRLYKLAKSFTLQCFLIFSFATIINFLSAGKNYFFFRSCQGKWEYLVNCCPMKQPHLVNLLLFNKL